MRGEERHAARGRVLEDGEARGQGRLREFAIDRRQAGRMDLERMVEQVAGE